MNVLPAVVFILWLPFSLLVFMAIRGHKAVATLVVLGWLFLPAASFNVSGLPDITKIVVVNIGTLLVASLLDATRFRNLRPKWYDFVVIGLLLCPYPTSITNGLSLYDGFSASLERVFKWGVPYLLGRVYFHQEDSLIDLAKVIFIGGLAYIPFCLFEMRMSPSLNEWLYGFRPRPFNGWRMGGWRPNVFLEEGLELGMFMTAATLLGFGLYLSNRRLRIATLPVGNWFLALLATTVLCRSSGALVLLAAGLTALLLYGQRFGVIVLAMLCLGPCLYVGLRATNAWTGSNAVVLADKVVGRQRAHSLGYRFHCENVLLQKALQRPLFGWGGYGRSRVKNEAGEDIVETDGLWIITLGTSGFVGLIALYTTLLMPPSMAWRRLRMERQPHHQTNVLAFALAILLSLYAIDGLLNWFYNPIYLLCAGALQNWGMTTNSSGVRHSHERASVDIQAQLSSNRPATPRPKVVGAIT